MKNVAYTSEYQDYRSKFNYIICDENLYKTENKELSYDYTLIIKYYQDNSWKKASLKPKCCSAQLINKKEEVIYSTQNIYGDAFFNLIEHKDGNQYLIFRIDLYGYSVLNLSTMKDYHFIPDEKETFIWTRTNYNRNTNLLTAEGCFWACPSGIFVVDFSDPTSLPLPEFDLNRFLDYDKYEGIDFINWDDNDNLVIKCLDLKTEKYVTKVIEKEILINELKREKEQE